MVSARQPTVLRVWNRLDSRLVTAFLASLLLHATGYGAYKSGEWLGLWDHLHWAPKPAHTPEQTLVFEEAPQPQESQEPTTFVDVHPATVSDEAPKDTPYYSDKNSRAANPLTENEGDVPEFTGTQDEMIRTYDADRPTAQPLQPSFPEPTQPAEPKPEPEAELSTDESTSPKGDLLLAKADDTAEKPKSPAIRPRPRTLKEALARLPHKEADAFVGRLMKQEGGVPKLEMLPSLDVRATSFGAYDRSVYLAVQNRWLDLLDRRGFGSERSGKVVIEFKLYYDGRITSPKVVQSTVNSEMLDILCQRAIDDPAPYDRWPSDMRRKIGADYREVKFTFYYQ